MKYTVVIIDDEPIIVQGLSKVPDWESLGCEVIATAEDAIEGMEVVRKLQPHILLTDINMPEVSGLEMLAALRSEFPHLQVTIISGYSDFHFAQEAMRLGACRYLLKPSKMDEIYEAIGFMTETLKQREKSEGETPVTGGAGEGDSGGTESERLDSSSPEKTEEVAEANSFIINQALAFMKAHHQEKLTLPQVAEQCYVSQWHLSKLLNGQLKKNFYEVLNQIRIEKAKELLEDGSLRVSDIAERVGYGEAAHFSRVFKKEMGMSAVEYRSTLKKS